MNPYLIPIAARLVLALLVVAGIFVGPAIYRRYTGVKYFQAILLWLVAICLALIWLDQEGLGPFRASYQSSPFEENRISATISLTLLCLLIVPFSVKLYRKVIGGCVTDVEKLPGVEGVRAWIGGGNFICAALIAVCAWRVMHVSLLSAFTLTFGLLLAYPLFNTVMANPPPALPAEDLSNEREKVLQLLEAGKITADESAELLNALGHSNTARMIPAGTADFSRQKKLILLGVGLLLVGFFLPWFVIDTNSAANELYSQVQRAMGPGGPAITVPQMMVNTTVQVRGGDLAHGTGWWILMLGIAAAALPFFATTLNAQMQKRMILAALCIGAFLLLYLASESYRYLGAGIVLAAAGYALEIIGTLKERSSLR